MPAKEHPCGALPVSTWSVHVWYCHEHQQWFASLMQYHENGSEDIRLHRTADIDFGPLDDHETVGQQIDRWVRSLAGLPSAWGKAALR